MDKHIPFYKNKDFGDINTISLIIGTNCNMQCRHCVQTPVRDVDTQKIVVFPKVWELLSNFMVYSSQKVSNTKNQNLVLFWGGEPLLYWDFIQDFVLRVEKELNLFSGQGFLFNLCTNGKLLTKDKVDFMNEHNIQVIFSYEAPHPFAIRGYVSDKICELVNKIKNCRISANCGNKYNCDPLLAYKCLKTKFPYAVNMDIFERLSYTFDMPKDICDYNWEMVRENYKKLRIAAQFGNEFALGHLLQYFKKRQVLSNDELVIEPKLRVLRCPQCDTEFSVTLDGKMSFCDNGNLYFNTVDDSWDEFIQNNLKFAKTIMSERCNSCRHTDICWKQCLLNKKDDNGNFIICDKLMIPLYDILKEQIMELAKPLSEEDKVWYQEQEKLMEQQVQDFLNEGKRYELEHIRFPIGKLSKKGE